MELSSETWIKAPWLGFDTETTGLSPSSDRLVTAAAVVRTGGWRNFGPDETQTWLVDPGVEIPSRATQVHGVSTDRARLHGQSPAEALEEINARLAAHLRAGWPVVIFNASYDLPLLEADSRRHSVEPLSERLPGSVAPIVDPLVLDRALLPYRRGKRTLLALCAAYRVPVPQDAHQADVDAQATLQLLAAMVSEHPKLTRMATADLDAFQRSAHADWAANLEAWHASKGRDRKISRDWF